MSTDYTLQQSRSKSFHDKAIFCIYFLGTCLLLGRVAFTTSDNRFADRRPSHYYHYATEAILAGRLQLGIEPRSELLKLSNPYDSATNQPYRMLDLSLYHGHYYFYWGLAPVVTFFAPIVLLTNTYPSEATATAVFAAGCLVCMGWLLLAIRKTYFEATPNYFIILLLVALGGGVFLPTIAASDSVYNVPIASAAFFQSVLWCCIFQALHAKRPPLLWCLLAGIALGLAVASRPNVILWVGVAILPLTIICLRFRLARVWLLLAAALPPVMSVGTMLWMNWVRFGRMTEFGMHYQLTGPLQPAVLFGWNNIIRNFWVYGWNPPEFSKLFPFLYIPAAGPFGVFSALPLVFLLLGITKMLRLPSLLFTALPIALSGLGGLVATCAFFGCGTRYMVDFLPACLLAGAIGSLAVVNPAGYFSRRFGRFVLVAAITTSILTSGLLQVHNWQLAHKLPLSLKRIANAPTHFIETLRGDEFGPVALEIMLPQGRSGFFEPFLSVGQQQSGGEIVFLQYIDQSHIRLGFFQTGTTHWLSKPIAVDYTSKHQLYISLGSLLPEESHPDFRNWPSAAKPISAQEVLIRWDGREYYKTALAFNLRSESTPSIGKNTVEPSTCLPAFSGTILSLRRIPVSALLAAANDLSDAPPGAENFGAWRIEVNFPENAKTNRYDPILVSGVPGAADFIYAFYPSPGQVAFGHDCWSFGGSSSKNFAIDSTKTYVLEVDYNGLHNPPPAKPGESKCTRAPVRVKLNGVVMLEAYENSYDADPNTVTPGENRIGGSTTAAAFSGTIISAKRVRP